MGYGMGSLPDIGRISKNLNMDMILQDSTHNREDTLKDSE